VPAWFRDQVITLSVRQWRHIITVPRIRPLSAGLALLAVISAPTLIPARSAAATTDKYFASFAYDIDRRVAVVDTGATAEESAANAESTCRSHSGGVSCQAVGWFRNGFGSFALGPGAQWGWAASAGSAAEADEIALENCGDGCHLTIRVGIGGPPSDRGSWAPLRDNMTAIGFTEDIGDHVGRDRWAVDMTAETPEVRPVRPGTVVFSAYNCDTVTPGSSCYGNVVAIDHGEGLYSIYTHLMADGLSPLGARVHRDTVIGIMSDTGCAGCGVHLHYALHQGRPGLSGRLALFDPSLTAVRTPWRKAPGM
jgi:hypothetical protein